MAASTSSAAVALVLVPHVLYTLRYGVLVLGEPGYVTLLMVENVRPRPASENQGAEVKMTLSLNQNR